MFSIFLMISDVEHLFMSLLALCISSLERPLSSPLPAFNGVTCLLVLLLLNCRNSRFILDINPLPDTGFVNILICLFTQLIVSSVCSFKFDVVQFICIYIYNKYIQVYNILIKIYNTYMIFIYNVFIKI